MAFKCPVHGTPLERVELFTSVDEHYCMDCRRNWEPEQIIGYYDETLKAVRISLEDSHRREEELRQDILRLQQQLLDERAKNGPGRGSPARPYPNYSAGRAVWSIK